jgi:hypothetical protein
MSLGALGYVGYGVETTEGTAVAPTFFVPVDSFSFEDSNDFLVPDQIRGSRDRSIAMAAPYSVSGSMEAALIPVDIGPLLLSAFSATVASSSYGGGGYQHIFTPGSAEPTLTFESSAADILVMRYSGVRVNTLELKAAFGEIVMATFGLEGLNREKQGSASSEDYSDVVPFHFSGASVKVDGTQVCTVQDATFSVGNNLERIGTLCKTRAWRRMALGMRDVNLSLTVDFTDDEEYDRFLTEDEFDVELHFEAATIPTTSNKYTLVIAIPKVKWNKVGLPLSAGDYLQQSIEALIVKPDGAAIFTATWVTSQNAATAGLP